jgi:hypothetical protein
MTADAEYLVRESCAIQGVPEHVEDPEVLARVASIIANKESTGASTGAPSGPRKVDHQW